MAHGLDGFFLILLIFFFEFKTAHRLDRFFLIFLISIL